MSPILADSIKRFFSHYLPVQRGLSANTILAYRDALKLLLCYAADTRKEGNPGRARRRADLGADQHP